MREPLIIRPKESAIGGVFDNAMKGYMAHPGYEAQYKGMEAAKIKQAIDSASTTRQAQLAQQSAMAQILAQHMAGGGAVSPWTNPDTGDVIQNTDPSAPLESPEERAARVQPIIGNAMVGPGVTNDMAKQFVEALAASKAMGNADEARQSMILGGHSIDQNFAPTAAEGNRIQHRNAWDVPLTDGQVKGKYTQLLWDKLSPRQQATVIDANKAGGMNLSMGPDGTTTMTSGGPGTFQPGDYGAPAATAGGKPPAPLGPLTNTTLSTMQGKTLQNQALIDRLNDYRKVVTNAPDSHFGIAGKGQILAGDVANQVKGVSDFAKSLGVKNTAGFADQIKASALQNGADSKTIDSLFNGTPEIMSLENYHNSLIGPVAQAISGAEGGRQPAEYYNKLAQELLEGPTNMGAGKIKTLQAIDNLLNDTRISQNSYSGAPVDPATVSSTPSAPPVPTGPMSAPVTTTSPNGDSATVVSQPISSVTQPTLPAPSAVAEAPLPPVMAPDAAASPTGPIKVKTRAEVNSLAPGTRFVDPYGVTRTKPHVNTQVPGGQPPVGSTPAAGGYD